MIIAVDFDGTVVERRPWSDTSPPTLKRGAKEALLALKRAGHVLVLWSARSNRSKMYLPEFDPLVRAGVVDAAQDEASAAFHADRYRQMLAFVETELAGIFDAIDDGRQGKIEADVYLDDRAIRIGGLGGWSWAEIAETYGE